jgi:MoxR-like ATPase
MNDASLLPAIHRVIDQVGTVILGKRSQVRLAIACLLARGHLLIEDVPSSPATCCRTTSSACRCST